VLPNIREPTLQVSTEIGSFACDLDGFGSFAPIAPLNENTFNTFSRSIFKGRVCWKKLPSPETLV
jgi:hypothetical protein